MGQKHGAVRWTSCCRGCFGCSNINLGALVLICLLSAGTTVNPLWSVSLCCKYIHLHKMFHLAWSHGPWLQLKMATVQCSSLDILDPGIHLDDL